MLPEAIRPINFGSLDRETWPAYMSRVSVPSDEAIRQFYRQVVYDHFDHHNMHYPHFNIGDYSYSLVQLSVASVRDQVKFFPGKSLLEMWGEQFDRFETLKYSYFIHERMMIDKTPPFPPIIIDSSRLVDDGSRIYGRPFHLIEGTHRTSYLLRMAERSMIEWDSQHLFVLLKPLPSPQTPWKDSQGRED